MSEKMDKILLIPDSVTTAEDNIVGDLSAGLDLIVISAPLELLQQIKDLNS